MKAKIDGIEIEGTVDEILNVIGKIGTKQISKPQNTLLQTDIDKNKYKRMRSSKIASLYEKAAELVKNHGYSINRAAVEMFPHRKSIGGSDYDSIRKILKDGITKDDYQRHNKISPERQMYLKRRGTWLTTRAVELQHKLNIPYFEALKIAQREYSTNEKKSDNKITINNEMIVPQFFNDERNQLFIDILRNCIANHSKITYFNEGKMLGLETSEDWNVFISSVLISFDKICKYFNCYNKFGIEWQGNHKYIYYGVA